MNVHASEVVVASTHPALPGHFPGRPIVPAAWLLTLLEAACRDAYPATQVAGIVHARFRSPLSPGMTMRIELERRADGGIAFACVGPAGRIADGVLSAVEAT